ncbi:MAG TPA: hypothetical protein VFP42_09120 [Acidimicrobiia bacterium]|nr:hypothetical protein [Acidimicrobiia bacterium]
MTTAVDRSLQRNMLVPVAVDADRMIEGRSMLRCTYFMVTTESPHSVWELDLPDVSGLDGLGALGRRGIVVSALRRREAADGESASFDLFTDADDISAVFALEADGDVSIQLEDIWLPRNWCEAAPGWDSQAISPAVRRGDVLRVGARLFQQAHRFAVGEIDLDQLTSQPPEGQLFKSPLETIALRTWVERQIEETRRAFPEKEVKLQVRPW